MFFVPPISDEANDDVNNIPSIDFIGAIVAAVPAPNASLIEPLSREEITSLTETFLTSTSIFSNFDK